MTIHFADKITEICLLCNSHKIKPFFSKNEFVIFKCRNCETEFLNPMPNDETISKVYESHAYHTKQRYDATIDNPKLDDHWQNRLRRISLLGYQSGALLDVGCATGIFLKNARNIGWDVQGIEASKIAAKQAKEVLGDDNIKIIDLQDFKTSKKYTVITMWALIEHVKDPSQYFCKAHQLLEPSGLLVLSTPNINSISCKLLKKQWRYYIPPEHLFYLNYKGISMLLSKVGFKVLKNRSHFRHIAYFKRNSSLLRLYNRIFIFRVFIKLIMLPLSIPSHFLHLGETIEIYAIKNNQRQV